MQKVIQIANRLVPKGTKEIEAEQVLLAAHMTFCVLTSDEKQKAIKDASGKIVVLWATIGDMTLDEMQKSIKGFATRSRSCSQLV